jgi:hypothetical protein
LVQKTIEKSSKPSGEYNKNHFSHRIPQLDSADLDKKNTTLKQMQSHAVN